MSLPDRMAELAELEARARRLGHLIGNGLPKSVGFMVLLFEWGEGGWSTYVSNAQRESMIESLESLLKRLRKPGAIRPPLKRGKAS